MKRRLGQVLIAFGALGGLANLYFFIFGAPFFLIKRDFKNPSMWKVPAALPDQTISSTPGMTLSYFGWKFEVPWTDPDPNKTRTIGKPPWQWQVVGFRSGRQILFSRHPPKYYSKIIFSPRETLTQKIYLRWVFGPDAPSDYSLARAVLDVTPDQLTPLTFRREGDRLTLLLSLKSIAIVGHDADSGIFMIDSSDFRGFQYGNPASGQPKIDDVLYSDRGDVEFDFCSHPPHKSAISQPDINRIIQTLKFLGYKPDRTASPEFTVSESKGH